MTRQLRIFLIVHAIVGCLVLFGCQRPPSVSGSAVPNSSESAPPMESRTTNMELQKRKILLDELLNERIPDSEFLKAKNLAMKDISGATDDSKRLAQLIRDLEFEEPPKGLSREEKKFAFGQYYFYERRFVEASQIFSSLLDGRPSWLRVRNLLARCFYFLGNTDRAFLELEYVVTHHSNQKEELLDALFLIGAIAVDSPLSTKNQVEKGVGAWTTYLKIAPDSPLRTKIQDGLSAIAARRDVKKDEPDFGNDSKSRALLAFEKEDTLSAESKIREALKAYPQDEGLKVLLARTFVKSGRFKEAVTEFESIIKLNPQSVIGHHYQGMAYMMVNEPEKAVAAWERVLSLDEAYGEKFDLKGRILIAKSLVRKESK